MQTQTKPQKIIIDTDPGSDDVLALLLALSAPSSHLRVLLISLTFGNIDLPAVLRNAITLFHILQLERDWRISQNLPLGFSSLYSEDGCAPTIAVGAEEPLEEERLAADYFHGVDGLGGVHKKLPHLGVGERWREVFERKGAIVGREGGVVNEDLGGEAVPEGGMFRRGQGPAHKEILRVLREEEEGSVVILALGPLTNLAKAAQEDLPTFLRAKEVILMGGTITLPGNVTPVAEFNHYACAYSASRIYALTSPHPPSMLPRSPKDNHSIPWPPDPKDYPNGYKPLNLTILPLDITCQHLLTQKQWNNKVAPLVAKGSPLATWCDHFIQRAFDKMKELHIEGESVDLEMHDPLTVYYLLSHNLGFKEGDDPRLLYPRLADEGEVLVKGQMKGNGEGIMVEQGWKVWEGRDIRVEAGGQWTRGMNVVETRGRRRAHLGEEMIVGDVDVWLHEGYGNRVRQVLESPGKRTFAGWLLDMVFGK